MGDLFGVAISPFELQEWQAATGIRPDLCMIFESWSRQRSLADTLDKAKSFGHKAIAVTWEPWRPTTAGAGQGGDLQPEWSHDAILAGRHDDYIDTMARAFRDSGLTVFLRYAHEMNGNWYPWHHDPDKFVAAWKYIRNRMRVVRGGWNIKFVWSPNADLWRNPPAAWLYRLMPYWPGNEQIDYIGFTMIEFGTDAKHYPVSLFAERFALTREIFAKPVVAIEVNVARERMVAWFRDLADYVGGNDRPLPLLVLSQGTSRAAAGGGTGDLGWNAASDPEGRAAIGDVVEAVRSS